jgi:hypothetical protein
MDGRALTDLLERGARRPAQASPAGAVVLLG